MVCTMVPGPSSGAQEFAAASTSKALVAMMTRSQGPMPSVVVDAWIGTVRSPLAPSQRSPLAAIASAWSGHSVTAWTSWPASTISAA